MMCGTAKEKAIITRNSWNKQKLSEREQNFLLAENNVRVFINTAPDMLASSDLHVSFNIKLDLIGFFNYGRTWQ